MFTDCLKFAQSNRLCCGGHGYSAASGLSQIIQEADAACTYEGDNVILRKKNQYYATYFKLILNFRWCLIYKQQGSNF